MLEKRVKSYKISLADAEPTKDGLNANQLALKLGIIKHPIKRRKIIKNNVKYSLQVVNNNFF